MLIFHFSVLLMWVTRHLNGLVIAMGSPEMFMGVLGRGLCLKSMMSACVLDGLSWRLFSTHEVTT